MKKESIDDKIKQLEEGMNWFESDDFKLDQAVERYHNLIKLSEEIKHELQAMQNSIEEK